MTLANGRRLMATLGLCFLFVISGCRHRRTSSVVPPPATRRQPTARTDSTSQILFRSKQSIDAVAFSPDGKYLVSGGADACLRLWDLRALKLVRTIKTGSEIYDICYSPDGRFIAAVEGYGACRLYSHSLSLKRAMQVNRGSSVGGTVHFSPDGRNVASGGMESPGSVWSVKTGKLKLRLIGSSLWSFTYDVVFSPDGKWIATTDSNAGMYLREARTGKIRWTKKGGYGSRVVFTPDSKNIICGGSYLNVASGEETQNIDLEPEPGAEEEAYHGPGASPVFSPDGSILAIAGWRVVYLYKPAKRRADTILSGHTDSVRSIAFSPDGSLLATGSSDGTIRLWRIEESASLARKIV